MREVKGAILVALVLFVFALPAGATRIDVAALAGIPEITGPAFMSVTHEWTTPSDPGFTALVTSDVYFDAGSSIFTYVFTILNTANLFQEISGSSHAGNWDATTAHPTLDHGGIGAPASNFYSFSGTGDVFRATYPATALLSGDSMTYYVQSLRPPLVFEGDSLDSGGAAPFGLHLAPGITGGGGGAIPEPATMMLLGIGLAGLAARRGFNRA